MFFLFFSCLNPPGAWKFKLQKDCFVLDVTQAEEIQKSAISELQEWSENGKCWKSQIFKGKLRVFISYLREMETVSMFYNSSLF